MEGVRAVRADGFWQRNELYKMDKDNLYIATGHTVTILSKDSKLVDRCPRCFQMVSMGGRGRGSLVECVRSLVYGAGALDQAALIFGLGVITGQRKVDGGVSVPSRVGNNQFAQQMEGITLRRPSLDPFLRFGMVGTLCRVWGRVVCQSERELVRSAKVLGVWFAGRPRASESGTKKSPEWRLSGASKHFFEPSLSHLRTRGCRGCTL